MDLRDAALIIREQGVTWAAWRATYSVAIKTGAFERAFPTDADPLRDLSHAAAVAPDDVELWLSRQWARSRGSLPSIRGKRLPAVREPAVAAERGRAIAAGRLRYFSGDEVEIGDPPAWTGGRGAVARWPVDRHWSRISDLGAEQGDIKIVWEPSRFSHAFALARAYAASGDDAFGRIFWEHVDDWIAANPPEMGPNWRDGQEIALRTIAWGFGAEVFASSPSATPARVARMLATLWHSARHVERIHWYAKHCVRNNHSIAEMAGLFTVGTLYPFLPEAAKWRAIGARGLGEEMAWQVYDDGSYVQHSTNYARLAAQFATWSLTLAEANGAPLPRAVRERAALLLDQLYALQDDQTGELPNYGANDGALLFPLSARPYRDFRPALGALAAALGRPSPYPAGAWDEEAEWLVGPIVAREARPRASISFPIGGYHVLRDARSFAFLRCGAYRHRPSQPDMLHLDLSYDGTNVLVDAGSFSYNADPRWMVCFRGTSAHNTVTIDGRDQMRAGPRFLWLGWTRARLSEFHADAEGGVIDGEHEGYARILHRRRVTLHRGAYTIEDTLSGDNAPHAFRLHWLVNDLPLDVTPTGTIVHLPSGARLDLRVDAPAGSSSSWVRAREDPPRGWRSETYASRAPAWSFETVSTGTSARFVTRIGPLGEISPRGARP